MDKKLIYELFGGNELSDDYLTLLENYQMTKEDGILIRDETIEFVSSLNRYGTYEDYEMMMMTIDEFRRRFSDRFKKIHNNEMDLDVLNQYKPNKLYWQITNDRKKTKQLLTPYKQILQDPEIDAVLVCSSTNTHAPTEPGMMCTRPP